LPSLHLTHCKDGTFCSPGNDIRKPYCIISELELASNHACRCALFDHMTYAPISVVHASPPTRHRSPSLLHDRQFPIHDQVPPSSHRADRTSSSLHAGFVARGPRNPGIGLDHIHGWEGPLTYRGIINLSFSAIPLSPFVLDLPLFVFQNAFLYYGPFTTSDTALPKPASSMHTSLRTSLRFSKHCPHFGHRTSFALVVYRPTVALLTTM